MPSKCEIDTGVKGFRYRKQKKFLTTRIIKPRSILCRCKVAETVFIPLKTVSVDDQKNCVDDNA